MTSAMHPDDGTAAIATGRFDPTRLKTRQLALIVHLDTHRSVLRAADAAHMTQPAATKLLRELEETMGVPLFERHPRGVEPNWYGEVLVQRLQEGKLEMIGARIRNPDDVAELH